MFASVLRRWYRAGVSAPDKKKARSRILSQIVAGTFRIPIKSDKMIRITQRRKRCYAAKKSAKS